MFVTRTRRVVEEEVTQVITDTNSDANQKKWMQWEENRLDSLSSWSNQPHLNVQDLARAGFYRPWGHYTECFSCGLRTDMAFWLGDKDPETVHSELRPNCEFVKQLRDLSEAMKYEQNRLDTFASWRLKDYQFDATLEQRLARAGFYYNGYGTECFSCRMWKPLSVWQKGYDPMMVHRKHRPDCRFLTGQSEQQGPFGPYKSQKPKQDKKDTKQQENNATKKVQVTQSFNTDKSITTREGNKHVEKETKESKTRANKLIKPENNTSITTSQPTAETWLAFFNAS